MKKMIALLMSLTVIASVTACSSNSHSSVSSESTTSLAQKEAEPIKLTNKMSANELECADKHALTLLDEPEEKEHRVELQQKKVPLNEFREQYIEAYRDTYTEEEYEEALACLKKEEENGETEITVGAFVFIDGCYYTGAFPGPDYDGGEIQYSLSHVREDYDSESPPTPDDIIIEDKTAANPEEYYAQYREELEAEGASESEIDSQIKQAKLVFDAFIDHTYVEVPDGTYDMTSSTPHPELFRDPLADYRSEWEYDRSEVEAIKESIDEYTFYDDELAAEFIVHVVMPPNYNKDKTYPVLFLTDGVWRFGNTPALRRSMENGEAADVLLVSLGYSYSMDGTDEGNRFSHLVIERDKLLDFITDNVMPYLGEQYNIDYADSTLFGHSDGGVFAHNALFKSDKYENQPFGKYIIGSPAFWGLYDDTLDLDIDGCLNDYGYFDRNEKLNKSVFICGGDKEDPDYEDMYRGHDTTLEGIAKLTERLRSHGADVTSKLYDSHHYQFIPEMLTEYLKQTYPPEK